MFTGNVGGKTLIYDTDGWAITKSGGASQCAKFGTSDANGVMTTPEISLGGANYALLTFSAVGWGDNKKNTLTMALPTL